LFLVALPFYRNYPRLLVPLLVPLALAAGVGLEGCAGLALARLRPDAKRALPAGVSLALAAVAFVPGLLASRDALAVKDRGYAQAARFLRAQPEAAEPDLLITQHALLFYLHGSAQPVLVYDDPRALALLESGRWRHVVADLRLAKPESAAFARWLEQHPGELQLACTVANPLPEPFLVNSEGFEGLDRLRACPPGSAHERSITTIRIWRRADGAR